MSKLKLVRRHYNKHQLDEKNLHADPIKQFKLWLDDAFAQEKSEPNAMTLATVDAKGQPKARIVLLKEINKQGLVFYTNYESNKAHELAHHTQIALLFWWPVCERQVRIEGAAAKISAAESDSYFATRERDSQLGTYVSKQSTKIASREVLQLEFEQTKKKFAAQEIIPRPENWGGYRVAPHAFEFWQGGLHRLHDRIRFEKNAQGKWEFFRLAP